MPANWDAKDESYVKGLCDGADQSFSYIEQVERELTELRRSPMAQQLNAAALRVERQRADRAEEQMILLAEENARLHLRITEYEILAAKLMGLCRALANCSASVFLAAVLRRVA